MKKKIKTHLTKVEPVFNVSGNAFENAKNRLRLMPDGYPHFKLKIRGVGKVDCVYDPQYNMLVIPEDLFRYWNHEDLIHWDHEDYAYLTTNEGTSLQPIVKIHGVTAFGKYYPEVTAAIVLNATKIVAGWNLSGFKNEDDFLIGEPDESPVTENSSVENGN